MITYKDITTPNSEILADLMYQGIYQTAGKKKLPFDIIYQPAIFHYIIAFGQWADDVMIGAFDQDQLIGAAWSRLFPLNDPGYGTVNETIPELTLVVDHSYQQRGIGANLLKQLLIELKQAGYQQLSLSVTKENHARQLYEKHGFMVIETNTNKDDIIMLKTL